jgi:hypothetical protein
MAKYARPAAFSSTRPAASISSHKLKSERLAEDLKAFEDAGGKIEKLGVTALWKPAAMKKGG